MIALIPARSGSKRIPGKNRKLLVGQPLIVWTMQAAVASGCFDRIVVSSDDCFCALAQEHGCDAIHRPADLATDTSPDIQWVRDALHVYDSESFAILRPTSPFRTAATIQRAFNEFHQQEVHAIRAVQRAKEHPGKQWWLKDGCLVPVLPQSHPDGTPWHSSPTQTLPVAYVQNASLEMAYSYVVDGYNSICGKKVAPFFTEGLEGFDLNTPEDWAEAERLIATGAVTLP